jgi:hypothetical protein
MTYRAAWRQEQDAQSSNEAQAERERDERLAYQMDADRDAQRAEHEQDERDARGMAAQRALVGQRPIDLDALVVSVLDGAVGDQPMTQLATMDGACDAVIAVVVAKVGRPLSDGEKAKVYISAGCEFNRRRAEKRAQLAETQRNLSSPFRVFQ